MVPRETRSTSSVTQGRLLDGPFLKYKNKNSADGIHRCGVMEKEA
jgi:hypothetical protein